MGKPIVVDSTDATAEQLLIHLLDRIDLIDQTLNRMENRMSDLTASVDALKGAVDGVAQRLLPQISALEASLAAAQADDASAAIVLADAVAASAAIRLEVERLNALGANPSTPVDPAQPDAGTVPDVAPEAPAAPVDAPAPAPDAPAETPAPTPTEAPVDTPAPEAPVDTPAPAPEAEVVEAPSAGVSASPTPDA